MSVTPIAGLSATIPTGGTSIAILNANINGGFIQNPPTATESLFVDPTGASANTTAGGTTFEIVPGGTWIAIPLQTTQTKCNAVTSGHALSSVQY